MDDRLQVHLNVGMETDAKQVSIHVDKEIEDFNRWFTSTFTGVSSLAAFERSILKTYLMWKLGFTE